MEKLLLGCIGDDFSGSSDAASFISAGGLNTILVDGVPDEGFIIPDGCEAIVIALKTRSCAAEHAVEESKRAARWLEAQGVEHFYFKYCSTFDSTPAGNIGPVTDALMELLGSKATILCPALPANERIVQEGILYVKGLPLDESPMKDHPLNPMWDSRIKNLIEAQGAYQGIEVHKSQIKECQDVVNAYVKQEAGDAEHWYIIPDYVDENDAEDIVRLFGDLRLLTGGSGVLRALARYLKSKNTVEVTGNNSSFGQRKFEKVNSCGIIIAGSCSVATRGQEIYYMRKGCSSYQLDDHRVSSGDDSPGKIWRLIEPDCTKDNAPLVYSYATPQELKQKRNEEGMKLARSIEKTLAGVAKYAVESGVERIVVAGGETSGAVTQILGFKAFYIGESIAPGVPILIPVNNKNIRLVLKSGNFGRPDFFEKALEMT